MHRKSVYVKMPKDKNKSIGSSDNKDKDKNKKLIKSQSEIEKELNIRSYSEYRVKDEDSMLDYEDEDIETKMIRLVILKRKGINVNDKIFIPKKKNIKKELPSKLPKIKQALSILENIDTKRKIKNFFKKLRAKSLSVLKRKKIIIFNQKIKKYARKIILKKVFHLLIKYFVSCINNKELLNRSKSNNINYINNKNIDYLISPQTSKKKIKKFKWHNSKNIKFEMVAKKSEKKKKNGINELLEKIEKEKKEKERQKQQTNIQNINIISEKLQKLDSLKKLEKEYLLKIKKKKEKIKDEIKLFKKKTNISDEGLSQIKQIDNQTEKDSSFFSAQSPNEIGSDFKEMPEKGNEAILSEVISSGENDSSNLRTIKIREDSDENNEKDLYSIKSKESIHKKNSNKIDTDWVRKSVKNLPKKNLEHVDSKKNLRVSVKLSELKFKPKHSEHTSMFSLRNTAEIKEQVKDISSAGDELDKSKNEEELVKDNNKEDKEDDREEDEEGEEDESDIFIKSPEEIEEEQNQNPKKINLVEYDLFYKEDFLRNDVFKYDAGNIKDKEVEKINKEINKLDIKRKLNEKRKEKEVKEKQGIEVKELQEEINELEEKYKDLKKEEKEKIELNIDTTEEFYNKGKFLSLYFENKEKEKFPKFAKKSAEDIGAEEIIDFKPLRKEEASRRYFDYCFCLEQRKKINKFLVYARYVCKFFVDNWIFDYFSLLMIICNTILMFISDPTVQNNLVNKTDNYFLVFYLIESILKIVTFTFYDAEDAYLKDNWNILDFSVVVIGIISFIIEKCLGSTKISGLSALKAFRILRPLKTVKSFPNLKKYVMALLASVSHLGETGAVLFCFFLFFAVAGLQMWQGLFYRRCMNLNYGYFVSLESPKYMCSFDSNCESLNSYGNTFVCAKGYLNPNLGAINFDNIGTSLITVFVTVTLEGWSYIFTYVSKTFKDKIYINPIIIFIYFHIFVYLGAYYLINLFLAVTNTEFERIDKRIKEKSEEKESFYKLMKMKYDIKEKQKIEKKEKEKKLNDQNNKKTNENLKELSDKIIKEAFHIKKNQKKIPKLYKTVKDIYIMANNNPEELYLEELRISQEEESLCLDTKRQLKEIEEKINKNNIEMEKSKANSKKNKIKSNKTADKKEQIKENEAKVTEKNKTSVITLNNKSGSESLEDWKNNKNNNLNQNIGNIELTDIIKIKHTINDYIIGLALQNTEKYFIDENTKAENLLLMRKEEYNKNNKNDYKIENKKNEISFKEDTKFEKELYDLIRAKNEKLFIDFHNRRKLTKIRHHIDQSYSFKSKIPKDKSNKKLYFLKGPISIPDNTQNNIKSVNKELSCIDDLSLSSLTESSKSRSDIDNKLKYKKGHTNIRPKNNINLSKILLDDFKNNIENLSYDDDLFNNNLFGFNKFKKKALNLKETEMDDLKDIEESSNDNQIIVNSKAYEINEDYKVVSNFFKPHSLLNNINKYEDEQKFNEENIRFNLKKYLKKEVEKDNEFLNKDRRKSFLGFLEYAQFQKELKELDDLIKNESEKEKDSEESINNEENDLRFLSEDSFLSRNNNVSVEDIELLPKDIHLKKVYENEYLIHSNIKKNIDSNKLSQKLRAEVFDRQSINTNIHLTTNELKKFYEEANKKLDEQLYVNKKKIRIRNNDILNRSAVMKNRNYNKTLKAIENTKEEEEKVEEKKENKENNIKNEINNEQNQIQNNLNLSENALEKQKKFENKISIEQNEDNKIEEKRLSKNKVMIEHMNINRTERNSDLPLLNRQKTMKILNLKVSNNQNKDKDKNKNLKFNIGNKSMNKSLFISQNEKTHMYNNNSLYQTSIKNNNKNQANSNNRFIFKAKSIEKNVVKYPSENSNKFLVKEENKKYTDPLTVQQEQISPNLRGKKYYMNYLFNIQDKDLKVKDNYIVDHWENEIYGKRKKIIKIKPLPERSEAFFVFNNKKLKLKKYKYMKYSDIDIDKDNDNENDLSYITNKLKYLPFDVLALISKRGRDFGKDIMKKDINQGVLSFRPDSHFLCNIPGNIRQLNKYNSRSGKTCTNKERNRGGLMMSAAFIENGIIQDEIRSKKIALKRMHRKIDEFNYLTLSHYFLNEQNLYYKFLDSNKKDEIFNNLKEKNREKYNRLNVRNEVVDIKLFDVKTNSQRYMVWSGEDVLYHSDIDKYKNKWDNLIKSLEDFNIIIWNKNTYLKNIQKLRRVFYEIAKNDYFDYAIISIVLINSFFLGLDGNYLKPETLNKLNISNYIFNGIFIFEYIIKFIGLTPLVYFSDAFTFLDTVIICFAIVDMASSDNNDIDEIVGAKKSVSSQFSFLRVFRIFRIVRLAKILRRLKKMRLIIISIKKALSSISYIVVILIMFILIFELLGMLLLNGNRHYQTFLEGFFTTYQVLTLENWDGIFIEIWPLNKLCIFYFASWIFLGNYILFNLFISILIQSFAEKKKKKDEDDLSEDEKIEKIENLPDYLFALKIKNKDNNLRRIHEQRKEFDKGNYHKNNDKVNKILNISNTFSRSNDGLTKFSSSFINFNNSNIIINSDEEEQGKSTLFFTQASENDEALEDYNTNKSYIGIEKQIREWQKINKLFKNNECEFFLPQDNWFRILCMKLINKKWFDNFILLIIILSTIRLIIDTFINGFYFVLIFDTCDAVFNIIFLLEAFLKICALGFAMDEGAYLQDNWNKLDAIIVACSFVEFHNLSQKYFMQNNNTSSIEFLKVLRLLRTLRPLRFISHNFQLKLIITSLFDSIFQIINVLIILIVVLFMFSVVGISLFYSSYHNCYTLKQDGSFNLATNSFNNMLAIYEVNNDITSITKFCADKFNGIMDTGPSFKFSNFETSLITSYILSTMEGWPDIMNSYRIYNDYYGIYFIAFNLIVAYFFLNLFTGIMFNYFNLAYKKEQKISPKDKKAPKYYDFLIQITGAENNYIIWKKPMKGTLKSKLRNIVDSESFETAIMIVIVLNMITMCLTYDGCSEKLTNFVKCINNLFTFIFLLECALKLFTFGIKPYFHVAWNKFDFFVVIVSIIDWIVAGIDGIDAAFLKTFQIIRVLKVLRASRVLRLIKTLSGIQKLIQNLQWSFYALINVLSLIIIIYCILALIACYLYDGSKYEQFKNKFTYINEYYNMDNFYNSYLLVFRCATGENWHNIMTEMAYREDGRDEGYSILFFIISNFITGIILSNLLLMITLQQYDEFENKNYNPVDKFNSFLSDFNDAWNKFTTEEDEGFRIKKIFVASFLVEFNWKKLPFPDKNKLEYASKYITDLDLIIDNEDYVYYYDVIFKLIFKQMGSKIDRKDPENNLIFKTEKNLQKTIRNIINDYLWKNRKLEEKQKNIPGPYKPLASRLCYKYSYLYLKTFITYYKERKSEMEQNYGENNNERMMEENENSESNENSENSSDSNENGEENEDNINENDDNPSESGSNFKSSFNKEEEDSGESIEDKSNNKEENINKNIYNNEISRVEEIKEENHSNEKDSESKNSDNNEKDKND